jgi:hypothetical protein
MYLVSTSVEGMKSRNGTVGGETRHQALGRFLRERRESLAPEEVGITSHRGRRTPGLRREEVAFLADIGVKWYARLEAGDDIHPSTATLTGIALALRLSSAELDYMLELAGLRQPLASEVEAAIPVPVQPFVARARGVAVTLGDRILTPLHWNPLANVMYGHSRFKDPVERNSLVRGLLDPNFIEFLGPDRNELIFRAVGMFRLNYSSPTPSPFAAGVYEKIKEHPLFQQAWKRRIVAGELTRRDITIRNHALVGKLEMYAVDLNIAIRTDLYVRTYAPANDETVSKFAQLERIAELELLHSAGGP